jgi:hypothetical protein
MKIHVTAPMGCPIYTFNIEPEETIKDLKVRINEKTGMEITKILF